MSTKYTDTSPVVVSPEPKRSSCSCAAIGCGCVIIFLIIVAIGFAIMWPKLKRLGQEALQKAELQFSEQYEQAAIQRIQSDSRVTEKLGEPITITVDENRRFRFQNAQDYHVYLNITGPNGTATAQGDLGGQPGSQFSSLVVTFEDGSTVDLMQSPATMPPSPMDTEPGAEPPTDPVGDVSDGTSTSSPLFQEPYSQAVQQATTDQRVVEKLGEPVRAELIHGEVEPSRSQWQFALHGANGNATANASGESDGSAWKLSRLEVTFEDGEKLDLMSAAEEQP